MSPSFRIPCLSAPPRMPPIILSGGVPGLFVSKLRAT